MIAFSHRSLHTPNEKVRLFFRRLAATTTTTSNYEAKLKVITGKCRRICTIYNTRYVCIDIYDILWYLPLTTAACFCSIAWLRCCCCCFHFVHALFFSCSEQFTHFEQTLYAVPAKGFKTNNIYQLYGKTPMRKHFFRESYKTSKVQRVSGHKKRRCR